MPAGVDVRRVVFAACLAVGLQISEAEGEDAAPQRQSGPAGGGPPATATPHRSRSAATWSGTAERRRHASAEAASVAVDCPSITGGEKWAAPRPPLSASGDPPLACETAELGRKVWPENWASLADPATRESKISTLVIGVRQVELHPRLVLLGDQLLVVDDILYNDQRDGGEPCR